MKSENKPNGYWNFEKCKKEALLYETRMDFKNGSGSAYSPAVVLKILDQICSHMKVIHNKWSKEKCFELIKDYSSLSEIKEKNSILCSAIYRLKIAEEVHNILGRVGNRYNKCIYSYEFPDNSVYVGLTYNIEERQKNRNKNKRDSVTKHILETGLQPIRKQLTEYVPVDDAIRLEGEYVEKYRSEGWIILNKVKTGAIGGTVIKWTKSACVEEAKKYYTKADFREGNSSAYVIAKNNKWINEICSHMKKLKEDDGYFTKEKCIEIGKKYNDLKHFIRENNSCYVISKRNNWSDEVYGHMIINIRKKSGYYDKEKCKEIASQFTNIRDFKLNNESAYDAARKRGWLNDICSHMKSLKNSKEIYTYDYCKSIAIAFEKRSYFSDDCPYIYNICRENNWLDDFFPNTKIIKSRNYWDKNNCLIEAKKYSTRNEFKLNCEVAYMKSIKNKWIDEIFPKIEKRTDYEYCKNISATCNSRTDLYKKNRPIYRICTKNNWLDEFFPIKK